MVGGRVGRWAPAKVGGQEASCFLHGCYCFPLLALLSAVKAAILLHKNERTQKASSGDIRINPH